MLQLASQQIELVGQSIETWAHALTPDQRKELDLWTGNGHCVNADLRAGRPLGFKRAEQLETLRVCAPLLAAGSVLWRGSLILPAESWDDPAFACCSLSRDVAHQFSRDAIGGRVRGEKRWRSQTLMRIDLAAPVRCLPVCAAHDGVCAAELEVALFPTSWRVTRVVNDTVHVSVG